VTELYRVYAQTHVAFVAKSFNPNDALVAACLRVGGPYFARRPHSPDRALRHVSRLGR